MPVELGTVIVTGGASGLGEAVAGAIAEAGGWPVVFDLRPPRDGLEHRVVDLVARRRAASAVGEVAAEHGGLDAVVTAAGVDSCGKLGDVEPEAWERVVEVNLLGTAAVIRAALPHLERSRGRVVTVASTLGMRALPDATAYCASKFGVVGFTRALAAEAEGRFGVTLLVPGGMQTAFFDGRPEEYRPPPEARLAAPGDVADAVVFALTRPPDAEVREMLVCPATESSWP